MQDLTVTIVPAQDDRDITAETRFTHLRKSGFVRGASAMDQWFILVGEAWQKTGLPMNELMRDYLTTMLGRFTTRPDLLEQLSMFEFVPYLLGARRIDSVCTQDVADMSLQYVAFFPERSKYRREPRSLEYSASIGESLYRELSTESAGKDDWFSRAYAEMAKAFGQAVMVLRSMNPAFQMKRLHDAEAKKRAMLFPADADDSDTRRAFRQFDGMNFVQPVVAKDN